MALFDEEHLTIPLGVNHRLHDREFTNAAARIADNTFTNADIGKAYKDLDTGLLFLLDSQALGIGTFTQLTSISTPVVNEVRHNFSFGDVATSLFVSVLAGTLITKVEVDILTAFDGIPIITVGDVGNTSRLVAVTDVEPTQQGRYETNPLFNYGGASTVNFYLTAGGATFGNGVAILSYIL